MTFFEKKDEGYFLRVRLTPNSSFAKASGIMEDAKGESYLKINVVSGPEKGKANKELLDFLAKRLDIAKSSFEIVSGETDRWKKIFVKTKDNLEEKLTELQK